MLPGREPGGLAIHLLTADAAGDGLSTTILSLAVAASRANDLGVIDGWLLVTDAVLTYDDRAAVERRGGAVRITDARPAESSITAHTRLASEHGLPLVAITAAGGVVEPLAITELVRAMEPGVGVVDARVIPHEMPREYAKYSGATQHIDGVLCLVSPRVLEAQSGGTVGERAATAGLGLRFEPAAVVFLDGHAPARGGADAAATPGRIPAMLARLADSADGSVSGDLRAIATAIDSPVQHTSDGGPFATVIVRLRGTVGPHLSDLLLCLAAQSDSDFSVLLVPDGSYSDAGSRAHAIVDRHRPGLGDRVRLVEAAAGSRGELVNAAVLQADGRFVIVIDHEDVVPASFIETMKAAATATSLVRLAATTQDTRLELWPNDEDGHRVVNAAVPSTTTAFDHLDRLLAPGDEDSVWAFPRAAIARLGLRFDPQLDHAEDWDLILSGSQLLGVRESRDVGLIRRPPLGESAYAANERRARARAIILAQLDARPVILSPGVARRLRVLVDRANAYERFSFLFREGELRQPLRSAWTVVSPAIGLAAVVVRRVRRRNS